MFNKQIISKMKITIAPSLFSLLQICLWFGQNLLFFLGGVFSFYTQLSKIIESALTYGGSQIQKH